MIWSVAWLKGMGERALKTFCQSLVGVIGVVTITHLNIPWVADLEFAGLTTLASVLTSLGNADFTAGISKKPSVTNTTVANSPPASKPPVVSPTVSTTLPPDTVIVPPAPPPTV